MSKEGYLIALLLLVAAALRLFVPQIINFTGGEALEEAVTALGRTLLG